MKILSSLFKDRHYPYWDIRDVEPDIVEIDIVGGNKSLIQIKNEQNLHLIYSIQLQTESSESILESGCIVNVPFPDNYGHCLHDVIPMLLSIDKESQYQKIYTTGTPLILKIIEAFKIKFNKVEFIKMGEVINQKFKHFTIRNHNAYHKRDANKTRLIKQGINDFIKNNIKTEINNRLIYCTRNTSSDAKHGRMMNHENEKEIVDMLKNYCIKKNLIFTMFNGQENGETMSHIKQLKLFNEARVVVGPHGSAMANVIYLNPENSPKICEFCSGTEVQVHGGIFNKHYNFLFGYLFEEIYKYYLIPFNKDSTPDVTSIDIVNLKNFLEEI